MPMKYPKIKIGITIRGDAVEWLDMQVEKGVYANRSHAVQSCVLAAMKKKDDDGQE